jgi:hypothetical protein
MGRKKKKHLEVSNEAFINFCNSLPNFYPKLLANLSEGEIEVSYCYKLFKNKRIVTENYAKRISKVLQRIEVNIEYWKLMGSFIEKKE